MRVEDSRLARQRWLFVFGEDNALLSHRLDLTKACIRNKINLHVATAYSKHRKTIQALGITAVDLPIIRAGISLIQEFNTLIQLIKIIRRGNYRLVHSVGLKSSLLTALACKFLPRQKFVIALTGLGYIFIGHSIKIRIIRQIVIRLLKFALQNQCGYVMVQNRDDEAFAYQQLEVSLARIRLVGSAGVDLDDFSLNEPDQDEPVALYMGRYLADKGLYELARTGKILRERGCALRLAVAGRFDPINPTSIDPDAMKSWCKRGWLEDWGMFAKPFDALCHASIAVLPSYREGSPKFLAEAAACALPLVAFDVPGSRELVREGKTGLLVKPFDSVDLAQALEQLYLDAKLRKRLGKNARRMAERELQTKDLNGQLLEWFDEILAM
ncbi:MAG: glycosyltransferase family 4 protein [Pseudomonadota bacterium]